MEIWGGGGHRCSYNGEVQSTHWSPASVTIFVVIVYRHATLPEDGRLSTVEEPNIVKDFLFAVSDDKTHDAQVRTECSGRRTCC